MATQQRADEIDEVVPSRVPRPVEGGTEDLGGLGRFIDDLMGASRRRRRVERELEPLWLSEDEMPPDPPLSEAPPPVPGGTERIG
jgi:hypothetical protein